MAQRTVGDIRVNIRAGVADLRKDIKQSKTILEEFGESFKALSRTINQALGAGIAVAGILALKNEIVDLGSTLKGLADKGDALGDLTEGFKNLGGTSESIDRAKKATLGVVSSMDLMSIANKGLIAQIPNLNENFSKIAALGQRIGETTGVSATEGINKVLAALTKANPLLLKSVGITIDQKDALNKYAESLGYTGKAQEEFVSRLDKAQKRAAYQAAANEQLDSTLQRIGETSDSASKGFEALNIAWEEVTAKWGQAVNDSEPLRQGLRDLQSALEGIDASAAIGQLAALAGEALKDTTIILNLASAMAGLKQPQSEAEEFFSRIGTYAKIAAKDILSVASNAGDSAIVTLLSTFGDLKSASSPISSALDKNASDLSIGLIAKNLAEKFHLTGGAIKDVKDEIAKPIDSKMGSIGDLIFGNGGKGGGGTGKNAGVDQLAKQIESIRQAFAKSGEALDAKSLQDKIQDAIENGADQAEFQALATKLKDSVYKNYVEGQSEAIKIGALTQEQVAERGAALANTAYTEAYDKYDDHVRKTQEQQAEELRRNLEKAYESSVSFYKDIFANALNGTSASFADIFKDILSSALAEVAASASGNFSTSPSSIGSSLGKIFNDFIKSEFGSSTGGLSDIFGGATSPGGSKSLVTPELIEVIRNGKTTTAAGASTGAGLLGSLQGGANAIGLARGIEALSKVGHGNAQDNVTGISSGVGAAIGSFWGQPGLGAAIGEQVGKYGGKLFGIGGPSNEETRARIAAAKAIEDIFKAASFKGGLNYINEQGQLQTAKDVNPRLFNDFKNFNASTDFYGKYGTQNATAFQGVAPALADQFGMKDQAGQLGVILADSFQGSLEGLKAFIEQIGLTFEQAQDALIKRGKSGEESWLEIVTQINGIAPAFEKGLAGKGQFSEALDNLLKTAGRGQIALSQLRNVAIEAKEAGINSIQALHQQLVASGKFTTEQIDATLNALQQQGVKTIDQLMNASDVDLARIVAAMDAYLQSHGQSWKDAATDVSKYTDQLNQLDGREATIKWKFVTELDENTQLAIDNGMIPDLSTASTAKSPALGSASTSSVSTINTKALRLAQTGAAAKTSPTINIDARGASSGVDQAILNALSDVEDRAVTGALNAVMGLIDRGVL